ncbi:MlaC/ttg2D family ABC transporter substrate-binding protein [Oceanicola sp. S124]|uniref:MlaC/ttg2D family ABC transporter substrate-binding protein n=1 Tax=Oceanicola sp. S124 TaxID=1042378 RepID=UPI0002558154|nr:ABC transporter substrate-binding protein [Oceanicola sp. S124]
MTPISTPTRNNISRRALLAGLGGLAAVLLLPASQARALTASQATGLVDKVVAEINAVINSGQSEAQMIPRFEAMLQRYADVPTIARSCLGPAARGASAAQLSAYTQAFSGYVARKYGKRFREFIGSEITVTGARPHKDRFIVDTVFTLRGQSPFDVEFLVTDNGGAPLFYEMVIEGISMLSTERTEIGAMLDAQRGDIDALTSALRRAG